MSDSSTKSDESIMVDDPFIAVRTFLTSSKLLLKIVTAYRIPALVAKSLMVIAMNGV